MRFEYRLSSVSIIRHSPIFLHIDFEEFRPFILEKSEFDEKLYFCLRMVPPSRAVQFFFSNPLQRQFDVGNYEVAPYSGKLSELNLVYVIGEKKSEKIIKYRLPQKICKIK